MAADSSRIQGKALFRKVRTNGPAPNDNRSEIATPRYGCSFPQRRAHEFLRFDGGSKPDISITLADLNHKFVIGDGKFLAIGAVE